jgi:ribonuclease HI
MERVAKDFVSGNIKLHVEWVPGHTEVPGNEKSDEVAGSATTTPCRNGPTTLSYKGRITK